MKNITIPEEEYLALKRTINELQEKINLNNLLAFPK